MKKVKKLEEDLKNTNESLDVLNDLYTNNLEKNKKIEVDILTKNKYDPNGFDRDGYNINGVNKDGLDRYGIKRKVKKQVKLKLAKQNLLKIKKEKDMMIYLFFCLN